MGAIRKEWFLAVPAATSAIFLVFGVALADRLSTPIGSALAFLWLFAVVLGSGLSVVRHAEHLASRLGEPFGTLILTLAVTIIEVVSISSLMSHGEHNPAVVRDTIFAVVMILLNLMVGISLLIGGWRHLEQQFNLQGANAYLGVIIPLTVLSLILPNFTRTTPGPTLSSVQELFLAIVSIGLYATFLGVQTVRHRSYFTLGDDEEDHAPEASHESSWPTAVHALLLVAYMVPVAYLAEQLATPLDPLLETLHAPTALGGTIIALLVATPEAVGAVRAAAANRLQRSMNIFLGSVLSTIGLTIPAMLAFSRITGETIALGLGDANSIVLVLSLAVAAITFTSARTNVLQGMVHLVLFGAYLLLMFQQ
jgi:Ca2+:H+ antiporter